MIHQLITIWALQEEEKRQRFERRCQHCGNKQMTAERDERKPVACEKCKVEIPPQKDDSAEKG